MGLFSSFPTEQGGGRQKRERKYTQAPGILRALAITAHCRHPPKEDSKWNVLVILTCGRRHSHAYVIECQMWSFIKNRINTTINNTLKQMRKPRFLFLICVNCVQILPAQHNNNTQFKICIDRCFCFPLFKKTDNRIIYNLGKCVSLKQQYNANSLKTKCKSHSHLSSIPSGWQQGNMP